MTTGEFTVTVTVTSAASSGATIQADCKHSSPHYASGFRNVTLVLFTGYWCGVTWYTSPQTVSDSLELHKEQSVLYGCETWSVTLREEHRLRVFENRLLGKIFGSKREEVTGDWRK
jgi:hypothetical protein